MKDMDDRVPLEPLDPGTLDPGFWVRFHSRVMDQAQMELARRRLNGDLTVADTLVAWRKALVPTAVLAASLAGFFLMRHEEPQAPLGPIAVEEALIEDLDGEPIPTFLGREPQLEEVAFLSSMGGF
jgi:hypothetical protein